MKEKACKDREIIIAIWVTENVKQKTKIFVCVLCVSLFVLFCFSLLMYPNVNIPCCVGIERDKNQSKSCRVETKHTLSSGQWRACGGNIFSEGRAPRLSFSPSI
jgi:formate/nitrite transporter FocA (FNT family)